MDIPLDVIASHSSAHPVCMMCSQMGYKPRLRKKSLLGKRKNWLGINLQCVLFQSVHVILTEPVYFIKYMAVWNFCLLIFLIQIQIIKIQKGAKLTHAETFVSVLKKARLKINNPAYIDLVISSERLLHLPEDAGLSDITTLQFIDKHHPQ